MRDRITSKSSPGCGNLNERGEIQENTLVLLPYARGAGQEFSKRAVEDNSFNKKTGELSSYFSLDDSALWEQTTWPQTPWPQTPWPQTPWMQTASDLSVHINEDEIKNTKDHDKTTDRVIGDFIKVRKDNDKFGFVHDLRSGVIFYANSYTIDLINEVIDQHISIVTKRNPELIEALRVI